MLFALTTSIQHCTSDSSQGNETRKRNKRQPDWKGKLTLFTNDMIVYAENPVEFEKKKSTIRAVSEFSKVVRYKADIQIQLYFGILVMNKWKFKFEKINTIENSIKT